MAVKHAIFCWLIENLWQLWRQIFCCPNLSIHSSFSYGISTQLFCMALRVSGSSKLAFQICLGKTWLTTSFLPLIYAFFQLAPDKEAKSIKLFAANANYAWAYLWQIIMTGLIDKSISLYLEVGKNRKARPRTYSTCLCFSSKV